MSQENHPINRYSIASVLFCAIFQITIINIEAKTKSIKNDPIDHTTQKLITILRNDNRQELELFLSEYKGYDFNKLRNGLWSSEKSTALIECIILDAHKCLNVLLSLGIFKHKVLKKQSSHNFYPLDYALHPKIKNDILDELVPYYKSHNLNPEDYISNQFKPIFEKYSHTL